MELTGKLKEQVEQAKTKEEAKDLIAQAGMELTDEEMDQVAGGKPIHVPSVPNVRGVPGFGGVVGHHKEPV